MSADEETRSRRGLLGLLLAGTAASVAVTAAPAEAAEDTIDGGTP